MYLALLIPLKKYYVFSALLYSENYEINYERTKINLTELVGDLFYKMMVLSVYIKKFTFILN